MNEYRPVHPIRANFIRIAQLVLLNVIYQQILETDTCTLHFNLDAYSKKNFLRKKKTNINPLRI